MKAVQAVKWGQTLNLIDEDEEPVRIEFLPGMTREEIDEFGKALPCTLPDDIVDLLEFCRGFTGTVELVDFTGCDMGFSLPDVFPHGLPIAADGFGNFWVVDLLPDSETWGPIYYCSHDAPVILYQTDSVSHFLQALFKMFVPPHESPLDDVHEDRIADVWGTNPGVLSHGECIKSEDADLKEFAKALGPSFQFVDLREPQVGHGFSWGRYGPNTVNKRHGHLPIFAYQKKGVLARLFGR